MSGFGVRGRHTFDLEQSSGCEHLTFFKSSFSQTYKPVLTIRAINLNPF